MKIVHKMFIAPVIATIFLILIGAIALTSMNGQAQRLRSLKDTSFEGFRIASTQTIILGQIQSDIYAKMAIMASLDEKAVKQLNTDFEKRIADVKAEFQKWKVIAVSLN